MAKRKGEDWYKMTEEVLYRYNFIKFGLREMILEYKIRVNDDGIKASAMSEISSKTNKFNSVVENAFMNRISIEANTLEENIKKSNRFIRKIEKILSKLHQNEKEVVEAFYFEGMQVSEIVEKLGYSESSVTRYKCKAIEKIAIGLAFAIVVETNNALNV